MQPYFQKLKAFIGHPRLFEGAMIFAFLMFSIYPGGLRDVMRGCSLLFLLNLLLGIYRMPHLNAAAIAMICGFLVMLLANLAAPEGVVHPRSLDYFIAFPGMALGVHALIVRKAEKQATYAYIWYAVIVSTAVLLNAAALIWLQKNNGIGGVYSNPHHLGLFAGLTLPVLLLFLMVLKSWIRLAVVGIILVDMLLLFESNSKVSWLAFAIGSCLAVLFFLKGRRRVIAACGLFLIALIGASIYGLPRIIDRWQFFVTHLSKEARWDLWANTWELLKDGSLSQWLFGRGIGSFRYFFLDYATISPSATTPHFSFPHNGILQILFENGLVGFAVVFGGFLLIAICLMKDYTVLQSNDTRYLVITLFALLLIIFIHFMLTKSYYTKFIQYPLSMIIGIFIAVFDEFRAHKSVRK